MWTYSQSSGKMFDKDGKLFAIGYSGIGSGLNNPNMQEAHNIGPIPRGTYHIGSSYDSEHGPITMRLTPVSLNFTFGRDGFLIHGDLKAAFGQHLASHGCIILLKKERQLIDAGVDKDLEVVI